MKLLLQCSMVKTKHSIITSNYDPRLIEASCESNLNISAIVDTDYSLFN